MDFGKLISSEISKTGFVLEHEIAQALKLNGWTVISGKYYVDDNEELPREMDLLAYRVTRFDDDEIELYTTLVISCKKSDENAWALLAREINLKDPNTDYWPLHAWSNDLALAHQLSQAGKAKAYHAGVKALGVNEAIADPQVEVFAFQEMNKSSGAPRNDKAIFSAITSLVKAQAYELSSLPARKKAKAVYQFNLISVVGSEMYRLLFAPEGKGIASTKSDSEQYIARYIVAKRESFSRIRFLTSSSFASALADYGRLHSANVKWFAAEHAAFYSDIVKVHSHRTVLLKQFQERLKHKVKWLVEKKFSVPNFDEQPTLGWDETSLTLNIEYFESDEILSYMNESPEIRAIVLAALRGVYRYHGSIKISNDIPF